MSGHIDKEQLLSQVHNEDSKGYLSEAIDCYRAGAYRAAVVMTACSVFEDLRTKLRDFALYDDAAKEISSKIENAFDRQKSYEAEVFRDLRDSNFLGDPENKRYLLELLTARNRAAHASGLATTNAEAFKFITEGVTRILGRRLQWAEQGVSELLERMKRIDLFPSFVQGRSFIADEELEGLDPRVHALMISRMVDGIGQFGVIYDRNAQVLFECFAERSDPRMRGHLFDNLINNRTLLPGSAWLIDVLAADTAILAHKAKNVSAADAAISAIIANVVGDEERLDQLQFIFEELIKLHADAILLQRYEMTLKALSEKLWLRPVLTNALAKEGRLRDVVEQVLLSRTKSPEEAECLLGEIITKWEIGEETYFGKYLSGRSAFSLIVNFCSAGGEGMERCSRLAQRGCSQIPGVRATAVEYLRENEQSAWEILDLDDDGSGPSPEEFFEHYLKAEPEWLIPWWAVPEPEYEPSDEELAASQRQSQAFSRKFNARRKASSTLAKAG
ncbi:hypothetical protein J5277_13520 [Rhizobium sp. 16-449-1b]|uniref:hypothetical protein n=1 Tax=Rhizobium sp. 16-449-1b TaxID=2819989 RepID=UPI001ADBEF2A|nr:hypothetical protein [Rhizobium sp. 16-449-1b]MBO9195124.1 hypothetical protein [Rhizobium sp. 16-449-1b]